MRGNQPTEPERIIFSEKFACPVSGFTIPEIEPRLFSFNNPYGACPVCDGLGSERVIDPNLVVPDEGLSLRENAVLPWAKTSSPWMKPWTGWPPATPKPRSWLNCVSLPG